MSDINASTSHWLEYMTSPVLDKINENVFAVNEKVQNPTRAMATLDYLNKAWHSRSWGSAPKSIFEGLQTTVNLARTRADFNPLSPDLNGNRKHFELFTDYIASAPFLALKGSSRSQIKEASTDAKTLISAFVDAFVGITSEDKEAITKSVENLVNAAVSWSDTEQRQSNFTQNLLRTEADGAVSFHLYYSEFLIKKTEHKGTVKFKSEYTLMQAEYALSQDAWDAVKKQFGKIRKTSTDDWLNSMETPVNAKSNARATCLAS